MVSIGLRSPFLGLSANVIPVGSWEPFASLASRIFFLSFFLKEEWNLIFIYKTRQGTKFHIEINSEDSFIEYVQFITVQV